MQVSRAGMDNVRYLSDICRIDWCLLIGGSGVDKRDVIISRILGLGSIYCKA